MPGSPRVFHHTRQAFPHQVEPALLDRDIALEPGFDFIYFICGAALDPLHNVGLPQLAAIGDCRVPQRHLERCDQVEPLTYGYGDGFTLLPWNAGRLLFPPGGRDESWMFALKSYARSFPKPEHCHILSQTVNTQFQTGLVEENVAALDKGPFHWQGAVAVFLPAAVLAVGELKVTGAGKSGGRGYHAFL